MSKNINISVTFKELSVLEHFVNKQYIKPTNGVSAVVLLEDVNKAIEADNKKMSAEYGVEINEADAGLVSRTVLYRMLKKFREHEILADGIKNGKTKTLYITTKGVEFYASMMKLSQEDSSNLLKAYEQIKGIHEARFEANVQK